MASIPNKSTMKIPTKTIQIPITWTPLPFQSSPPAPFSSILSQHSLHFYSHTFSEPKTYNSLFVFTTMTMNIFYHEVNQDIPDLFEVTLLTPTKSKPSSPILPTWSTSSSPTSTTSTTVVSTTSLLTSKPWFAKATLFHSRPLSFPCILGHHLLSPRRRDDIVWRLDFFFQFFILTFFKIKKYIIK